MGEPRVNLADLPEPLRDPILLATIRALHVQLVTEHRKGSYSIHFDYDEVKGCAGARIVAPTMFFRVQGAQP